MENNLSDLEQNLSELKQIYDRTGGSYKRGNFANKLHDFVSNIISNKEQILNLLNILSKKTTNEYLTMDSILNFNVYGEPYGDIPQITVRDFIAPIGLSLPIERFKKRIFFLKTILFNFFYFGQIPAFLNNTKLGTIHHSDFDNKLFIYNYFRWEEPSIITDRHIQQSYRSRLEGTNVTRDSNLNNKLNKDLSFKTNFESFVKSYRYLFMAYHGVKEEKDKILMNDIIELLDTHPEKNNVIIYNLKNNFKVNFKGEKPYLGCELEVTFKDKKSEFDCLIELWNVEGIHLMNDSSVGKGGTGIGFEIITNPMGFREQALFFKRVLNIIKKYNGFCDSSCGFHIHIDKTDEMVTKVESITNQIDIELIGKRKLNSYCKLKRKNDSDRYTAVNLTNKETIELRFFRCTLSFKNILQYLLYAHNIVKYSETEFMEKYKKYKNPTELNLMLVECKDIKEYIKNSLLVNDNLSLLDKQKNVVKLYANILNCFKNELFQIKYFVNTLKTKLIEINSDINRDNILPNIWILKWNSVYTELLPLMEKRLKELD